MSCALATALLATHMPIRPIRHSRAPLAAEGSPGGLTPSLFPTWICKRVDQGHQCKDDLEGT